MIYGAFKSDTEVYAESEDYFCMITYNDRLVHTIVSPLYIASLQERLISLSS